MGKLTIAKNPELTKEKLLELIAPQLQAKGYEVGLSKLMGASLYVKKTGWVGAVIVIRQKKDSTLLITRGYSPSAAVRILAYGLITLLILNPKWKALVAEIEAIYKSPEVNLV